MKTGWLILVSVLLLASPAAADNKYDACVDAAGATMPTMGACGGAWIDREDARLNVAWKQLMAQLEEETKASILDEQRAWLSYRDASCQFYLDEFQFGQIGRYLSYPSCRAKVIAMRTQALKDILKSVESQ